MCPCAFMQLGTQGETSLNGVIGYIFEADSSISDCMYGPPAVTVRTNIIDQFPRAYINLSSWYKGQWTEPCGFKVHLIEYTFPHFEKSACIEMKLYAFLVYSFHYVML